jgi:hypothetical protein
MNRANTSPYWKRPDTPSNPSLFDPHQSALLSYLGDQGVADHDLWHPLGEFENVVPHPVRRLLIGGKRFIRAVKPADSDQHVWATIEQIIAPESGHLSQQGKKPSCTRRASSSAEPCLTLYFLTLVNMFFPV